MIVRSVSILAALALLAGCDRSSDEAARRSTAGSSPGERPTVLFLGTSLTAGYGLDPDEAFPLKTVRHNRVKDNRTQRVTLPHGFLAARDDDTPPTEPDDPAERRAWERALDGG